MGLILISGRISGFTRRGTPLLGVRDLPIMI
jgi:hypothetical protein